MLFNDLYSLLNKNTEMAIQLLSGAKKYVYNQEDINNSESFQILDTYMDENFLLSVSQYKTIKRIFQKIHSPRSFGIDSQTRRVKCYFGVAHLDYHEQKKILLFLEKYLNVPVYIPTNSESIRMIAFDFFEDTKIDVKVYYLLDENMYCFLLLYKKYFRYIMVMESTNGRKKYYFSADVEIPIATFSQLLDILTIHVPPNFFVCDFTYNISSGDELYGILK